MQRRTEDHNLTTTNTPGRIALADRMSALNERASIRDAIVAGGVRRMTVKETFGER